MALDHELQALEARARTEAGHRVRAVAAQVFCGNTIRAYRRLFLGPDGELSADAVRVIADLSANALIGVADTSRTSDAELRDRAGRRAVMLHLFGRLDQSGVQLREIAFKLREVPHE